MQITFSTLVDNSRIFSASEKNSSPTNKTFAPLSFKIYATSGGAKRQFIPTTTAFALEQPKTTS